MKFKYKKPLLYVAVALAFWACEKDGTTPSNQNNQSTKAATTKNGLVQNKSEGLTYSQIDSYVSALEESNEPTTEDWETALLLLESAINHTDGEVGNRSTHSEILEFTTEVAISESGDGFEVSASDALEFFESLQLELANEVSGSDLYSDFSNDVFVSVIDLQFEQPSSAGSFSVPVTAFLKYEEDFGPQYPYCETDYDWKALDRIGKCTGGTNMDAAIRLESFLTNNDCNSNMISPYCTVPYWTNVVTASKSGFVTSNIWDGNYSSDCVSSFNIDQIFFPGMVTEGSTMNPLPYTTSEIDYVVGKDPNKLFVSGVAHKLYVSYAAISCNNYP
ncbi:MAG: hypothetical protein RIC95_11210 [Vicingaceae bacterium]